MHPILAEVVKILEAIMPTKASRFSAILSLILACCFFALHGVIERRFSLSLWQTDAVVAIGFLATLLAGMIICIASITKSNYRLITERDTAALEHAATLSALQNKHAAALSGLKRFSVAQHDEIEGLKRTIESTESALLSKNKDYQGVNALYDRLADAYRQLRKQIEAKGLKPVTDFFA